MGERRNYPLLEQTDPFLAPAYVATAIALPSYSLALPCVTNNSPMTYPPRAPHRSLGAFFRARRPRDRVEHSCNPNISLPFHGSCSQCHHYHDGHEFTFSLSPEEHTRLPCQHCGNHMFGIGRTPTTFTLASVETDFPQDTQFCVKKLPQARKTNDTPEIDFFPHGESTAVSKHAPHGVGQSVSSNLREEVPIQSVNIDPGSSSSAVKTGADATASIETANAGPTQTRNKHALPLAPRHRQTIRGQLKKRICAKPRDWHLPRIGLYITNHPFLENSPTPPLRKRTRSGKGIDNCLGLEATNSNSNPGLPSPHTPNNSNVERTIVETPTSAPSLERPPSRHHEDQPGESVDTAVEDQADRLSRLRARRRKQTIQRENDYSVQCQCDANGHCTRMKSSMTGDVSDESLEQRLSSSSSGSLPSQDYPRGHFLFHIGHQFGSTSSHAGAPRSRGENPQRLSYPHRRSTSRGVRNSLLRRASFASEGETASAESNLAASNGHMNSPPSPSVGFSGFDNHNEHQGYQPLVNGVAFQPDSVFPDRTHNSERSEVSPTRENHIRINGTSRGLPNLEI